MKAMPIYVQSVRNNYFTLSDLPVITNQQEEVKNLPHTISFSSINRRVEFHLLLSVKEIQGKLYSGEVPNQDGKAIYKKYSEPGIVGDELVESLWKMDMFHPMRNEYDNGNQSSRSVGFDPTY